MRKLLTFLSPQMKQRLRRARNLFRGRGRTRDEVDVLYGLLYQLTHDWNCGWEFPALQTRRVFTHQWETLSEGLYLLSDPWFKSNVSRILSEEETRIKRDWFQGKEILDAGCGNGRWAFGLAQLGAKVTAVDGSEAAVEATRKELAPFSGQQSFYVAPLEELSEHVPAKQYDLVFCWGVLHHCRSFSTALDEVTKRVKDGGLIYLYLYGRQSMTMAEDLELFKMRLRFHLMTSEEKERFLLKKARGDRRVLHNQHDLYAPLINRRFEFAEIKGLLQSAGFRDITHTLPHTELRIRAVKGDPTDYQRDWFLPAKEPPYWFEHH